MSALRARCAFIAGSSCPLPHADCSPFSNDDLTGPISTGYDWPAENETQSHFTKAYRKKPAGVDGTGGRERRLARLAQSPRDVPRQSSRRRSLVAIAASGLLRDPFSRKESHALA